MYTTGYIYTFQVFLLERYPKDFQLLLNEIMLPYHLELDSKVSTKKKIISKSKSISEIIVDETLFKVGSDYVWLWVAIEPTNRQILSLSISKERNMFVAERFIADLVKDHGKHSVSTDGGGTWYPQACMFLKLKHHIHSTLEESLIERTMQYIKDRTDNLTITFHAE
jgi:transposase-like protein